MKKRLAIALLVPLVLFGSAEALYRLYWLCGRGVAAFRAPGDVFELYIVGESTATGQPYERGIPLSALVSLHFKGQLCGRRIRAIVLAAGGESIYPQSVALEQALRLRNRGNPGAVLIYAGHNDATTQRGASSYEQLKENVFSRSALLTDLSCLAERRFPFLRVRTLDTYEHYLRRVIEMSQHSGLVPIPATTVSNLSDIDPGLKSGPAASGAMLVSILDAGAALEAEGRHKEALRYYARCAREHPALRTYVEFRMAKCEQALGRYAAAKRHYQEIINLCPLDNFGRATSWQNRLIRALARQYSIPMADAVTIFETHSPHGIIGNSLFLDGHHPNMKGYLLLAGAYAAELSSVFHEPVLRPLSAPESVYRDFSFGKEAQAAALIVSGNWLYSSAARHVYPRERLKLARERYQSALALEPGDPSAWLGLGLAEAAMRRGLLEGAPIFDWLCRHRLFFKHDFEVTREQLREIAPELAACGLPPALLRNIFRAQRDSPGAEDRPGR